MKCSLYKLALLLILGAILNILVAWSCVLFFPLDLNHSSYSSVEIKPNLRERTYTIEVFGRTRINKMLVRIVEPEPEGFGWCYVPKSNRSYEYVGWPLRGLSCRNSIEYFIIYSSGAAYRMPLEGESEKGRIQGGIKIASESITGHRYLNGYLLWRALPYYPLWPGFIVNTIFYASTLWLILLSPFQLRRVIRRKRGHCIKCGYDLRGTSEGGCPECGWGREAGEVE